MPPASRGGSCVCQLPGKGQAYMAALPGECVTAQGAAYLQAAFMHAFDAAMIDGGSPVYVARWNTAPVVADAQREFTRIVVELYVNVAGLRIAEGIVYRFSGGLGYLVVYHRMERARSAFDCYPVAGVALFLEVRKTAEQPR